MTMKALSKPLATAGLLRPGGCMVGPDYHRPQVPVPGHYQELKGWTEAGPEAAAGPKGDWWTGFHDPLLDELELLVSVSNQTVRQDYANYQAALAEVRVARSALFPTFGVTGALTRSRAAISTGTNGAPLARVYNSGSIEGSVSWAPDLWGLVRRQIEESAATAQASEATLANVTLSEQIALATAVIDLRITDADIDLLQRTVVAYTAYLRVVAAMPRDHAVMNALP